MLIPGFYNEISNDDIWDFLRFGQFYEFKLIWDVGGQEVGQSTLYYALDTPIPFWQVTSWARDLVTCWVEQIWRFNPLNPLKPSLGRLIHQSHRLAQVKVRAYDNMFDMLTPDDAVVTLNEQGLRGGVAPEDYRHALNINFDIRPGALFQAYAPKRSYIALPAPSAQDFDPRGFLSPVAMNEMRPHLAALSADVDVDGTPFPFSRLKPIRLRRESVLVGGNPVIAVGYGVVGGVDFGARIGIRRSRVG